jgi:copper resistance protein B
MANALHGLCAAVSSVALALTVSATDAQQHADHAAPQSQAEHADHSQHTSPPSQPTDGEHAAAAISAADRAAAFPDLGAMGHMHLEDPLNRFVLIDRFESQDADGDPVEWDVDAWIGRDLTKLWVRTDGERRDGSTEQADVEVLWGKSFARWWDLLAGVRQELEPSPDETWAAVGVRGTAPYRLELAATAYVGDGGNSAARVETHYEVLVTNRWILRPEFDLTWYGQSDPSRGRGAGLAEGELGVRLRYEIRREVAPYVGLVLARKFGRTADLAVDGGDDTRLVAGIRISF